MSLIVTTQTTQRINYTVPDHSLEDALIEVLMNKLSSNLSEAGMGYLLDSPQNLKAANTQIRIKVENIVSNWCHGCSSDDELDVCVNFVTFESQAGS